MTAAKPRAAAPVAAGILAAACLFVTYVVPAIGTPQHTWPAFAPLAFGCQAGQRTVRHAAGRALGAGSYEPCLIDTGMTSGEPGLAISRDGTLLRSVTKQPTGIVVSFDGGQHWIRRALPAGARDGIPDGYVDPVTDRYFYSALGNSPVFSSDDKGVTWRAGEFDSDQRYDWNKVFSGPPVTARASGYPTNIYYCNMTQPGGFVTGTRCFRSTDGGLHFKTSGRDPYESGDCKNLTQPRGSGPGRGVVDPRDGTIYLPVHFCGAVEVSISRDEGRTWSRQTVDRMRGSASLGILRAIASPAWRKQLMSGRTNIVPAEMATSQFSDALAIDPAGRLFLLWIDESQLPVLAWSGDKGRTWSKPVSVGHPDLAQAVLPSIAIDPNGRVGISYYGSVDRQTWTGYLAVSDGASAAMPIFETAVVTPPGRPLMPEACCWANGPQEYTVARWAPDGSLWGAFAASAPKGDARGVMGRLVRH